ncbi:MAG: hypothetical protein AAF747_09635 [Planctomycetota bacterium]
MPDANAMIRGRSYLSVVQWPDEWSEDDCIGALVHAGGGDVFIARQAVRRGVPGVVHRGDYDEIEAGARGVADMGAVAFAAHPAKMDGQPSAVQAKQVLPAGPGRWEIDPWRRRRDDTTKHIIEPGELFLIVRGTTRSTTTRVGSDTGAAAGDAMLYGTGIAAMNAADGAYGSRSSSTEVSELLELQTRDGRRYLIDGRKFNETSLHGDASLSARDACDLVMRTVAACSPRALIDRSFNDFRCPPDILKRHFIGTSAGTVTKTGTGPAFEFYCRWVRLMYLTMLAG